MGLLGEMLEECLYEEDWEPKDLGARGCLLRFTEDSASPRVSIWSSGGKRLCCLPNSTLHHFPWPIHGHRWHAQDPPLSSQSSGG